MPDDLRTRLARVLHRLYGPSLGAHPWGWDCEPKGTQGMFLDDADAVIREITEAIPPIVASAIRGYAQSELVAITHHGEAGEYDMLKRLNREALQIALYATTHKDWNG